MNESHIAYLSAGSNIGDRQGTLISAVENLRSKAIQVCMVSSFYETEPVDFLSQPWFLNMALEIRTALSPRELLHSCREIEEGHGRARSFQGAPRTLDIDILLYGDQIIAEPDLQIPHPRMERRRFVLEPLAEIAPHILHPILAETIQSLLAACPDSSRVVRLCGWKS
jgi:2-amino-4-hydroxy-6-hydroxymethyldihydropteridine diphosphokinase